MNHLNNYFQKGAIIFVIVMLIIIPNLHVCSSIGSYQTSSPAITVINTLFHQPSDNPIDPRFGVVTFLIAVGVLAIAGVSGVALSVLTSSSKASVDNQPNYFNETYRKYDFSGFDN